jgi:stearoyl-CoA desaturase (delta-9 desaturase)
MQLSLLDLPWWGLVLVTLGSTHVTIAAVTIFLHRHQAHRALELHPVASHFFRFWLWLTTGMVTKEWTAIHRKHHANCESSEDPHSPQIHGIGKVLFEGTELYRMEARNAATLEKYGHGTPDDWIERNLYARHTRLGIGLVLGIDIVLFGPIGLSMWAVQMLWIPFFAAGVINGVGHYLGYRSFETQDASRNIFPIGVLVGGEEFHNNHHAYSYSAKLANKWWELDIGWVYIRLLEICGLASVKKVSPRTAFSLEKRTIDSDTVRAIVANRFHVLKLYGRRVIAPVLHGDTDGELVFPRKQLARVRKLMIREDVTGLRDDTKARQWLEAALQRNQKLRTVYQFMQQLKALSNQSTRGDGDRLTRLQTWCAEAEASGIRALRDFARQLQAYTAQPA